MTEALKPFAPCLPAAGRQPFKTALPKPKHDSFSVSSGENGRKRKPCEVGWGLVHFSHVKRRGKSVMVFLQDQARVSAIFEMDKSAELPSEKGTVLVTFADKSSMPRGKERYER